MKRSPLRKLRFDHSIVSLAKLLVQFVIAQV
jgi:hypothetical protein